MLSPAAACSPDLPPSARWRACSACAPPSARYYDGPVSDHFDGTRFFDPHGSPPKSLATLLRWYCGREKAEWPAWAPSPYSDRPPRARRRAGMAPLLCRPCQLAAADRRPEHPDRSGVVGARLAGELRSGRSASTTRASRSTRCRRSTSCWCRIATTTISTSRRCRGSPRSSIARVITPLGNDTIMKNHDAAIRAEAYRLARPHRARRTTSPSRWCRRSTGRRAA